MPTISQKEARQMGIPKKTLQTIEIPNYNKIKEQKAWLKENGYVHSYYRKTPNFTRWMQVFPIKGADYYSKILPNGVILVYQEY